MIRWEIDAGARNLPDIRMFVGDNRLIKYAGDGGPWYTVRTAAIVDEYLTTYRIIRTHIFVERIAKRQIVHPIQILAERAASNYWTGMYGWTVRDRDGWVSKNAYRVAHIGTADEADQFTRGEWWRM